MTVSSSLHSIKNHRLPELEKEVELLRDPTRFSKNSQYVNEFERVAQKTEDLKEAAFQALKRTRGSSNSDALERTYIEVIDSINAQRSILKILKPCFVQAQNTVIQSRYEHHRDCSPVCEDKDHLDLHIKEMTQQQEFLQKFSRDNPELAEFISDHKSLLESLQQRLLSLPHVFAVPAPKRKAESFPTERLGLALVQDEAYPYTQASETPSAAADGTIPVVQTPPGKYIKFGFWR